MQKRQLTEYEKKQLDTLYSQRVENYLDTGMGECWLKNPRVARLVVGALKYFDKKRYDLNAWCVMPNHVHAVFKPYFWREVGATIPTELSSILHSWKWYTATEANLMLSRTGRFWEREYFDHLIRDEEEFWFYIDYTLQNPVKAGFCHRWADWPWAGVAGILSY